MPNYVLSEPVLEAGDGVDLNELLRVPAGAAVMADVMPPVRAARPPWMPLATPDVNEEPGSARAARTVVSEAALRAIVEAAVWKSKDHPRWPKGSPNGQGGKFIHSGQRFTVGGKTYEVAHIVKGKVVAHEASAKYGSVETKTFDVEQLAGEEGPTIKGATYHAPVVPEGGKGASSKVTIVDPYVDASTHDPSIPVPSGSALTPEQWQRFGGVDQRHYAELMERFGKHKPGAAKAHIDASYKAYQSKVQQMVKEAYSSQYGASTGFTLSLATGGGGGIPNTPEMAKLREEAQALMAEHRAAVQWDLYNRTLSPDVLSVHKSKSWTAQQWHDHAIKGDNPAFSGLSQSWNYRAHFFGSQGVATPLAIRHILLSSHSAQPIPGESHFSSELEISVPEQLKLDHRSVAFSIPGVSPGGKDAKMLTASQNAWLEGVTQQPMGGELVDMLKDSLEQGTKLPTPPAPPHLVMDAAGGKTWADPPVAAASVLPNDKLPGVKSNYILPSTLDKSLPWQHLDENGAPKAVTGEEAGAKAGQYFMGLKGTLYWLGNDPGNQTGYPFRIHKIENGAFNGESWAYNADMPGYYLDAHHEEVLAKPEDVPAFDPAQWVNGTDQQFLEDFSAGDKFKLNGAVYEVTGPQVSTGIPVKDMDSGLTGKINGNYKTVKLVPKGSAEAALVGTPELDKPAPLTVGQHVMTPDGHGVIAAVYGDHAGVDVTGSGKHVDYPQSTLSPWAPQVKPQAGLTFPYSTGPGETKKATVTVVKADGDVQVNLAPGKVVIPADEWAAYADKTFDPGAWNVADEPVKLRDLKPGDKFQGSAGHQTLRPYEVLAVPSAGKVTVRNMDTGQVSQMSRNVSYRRLDAKPAPGSAAEATQDTPDSPAATPSTPQSTALHENIDPANLQANKYKLPPGALKPGDVISTNMSAPQMVVTATDDLTGDLTAVDLSTGKSHSVNTDEMSDVHVWYPKGEKSEGDLTAGPPPVASQEKLFVELNGGKFVEGETKKLGDMDPGTVFKTVSAKQGGKTTYYKVNDAGTHSVNLSNGKSYPLKGGWKATVMQPAPTREEGDGGVDPATFNVDDWENAGGSLPLSDVSPGTVFATQHGDVYEKKDGSNATLLYAEGFTPGATQPMDPGQTVFPLAPSGPGAMPSLSQEHPGLLEPSSLKNKPGSLFTHKGVTMSVAQDQSLASGGELIAVAPDGKGWLVTSSAGGVTPVPGHGPTKHVNVGDTVVWNGQLATVTDATGAGGDGETPGGHLDLELMTGDTAYAEASAVTHLPSASLKPGDLVHAFKPADPLNPSLGPDKHVVGHVKHVLPSGLVQVDGSLFNFKPEHVDPLDGYPFKPGDKVQTESGFKGSFIGWDVIDGQPHAAMVGPEGDESFAVPEAVSLASTDVPEMQATVVEPKAEKALTYEQLAPGDMTTVGALQPGDQYVVPIGKMQVVEAPPSPQDNAKVAWVNADGALGDVTELWPDASVALHAKAADAKAAPAPVEHVVDWDTLPDAQDHGLVGYKSHKGSGGKWSHHQIKSMAEGTIFADLNGKQWKVKQAGAKPVITDGEGLFQVNGSLRGKDLNQPAVKQNASLVDNSPPLGWVPAEPAMVPNTQPLSALGLQPGDQIKVHGSESTFTVTSQDAEGWTEVTGMSGAGASFPAALKPSHVSAAALVKPNEPGQAAPAQAAPPTVHTQPSTAGKLNVGDEFKLAPGSTSVYTVKNKFPSESDYLDQNGELHTLSAGSPVYVEPKPEPVKPPEPSAPAATVVDPASVEAVNGPEGFAQVPEVPVDPVVKPQPTAVVGMHEPVHLPTDDLKPGMVLMDPINGSLSIVKTAPAKATEDSWPGFEKVAVKKNGVAFKTGHLGQVKPGTTWQVVGQVENLDATLGNKVQVGPLPGHGDAPAVPVANAPLQAFGSRLGPGGVYKHDKLSELQVGQLFTDKTGHDYQLVGHGEGMATYKSLTSGDVFSAPNGLRVKRTALPPDPGPMVTLVLSELTAKYGGLENVPAGALNGYTSATGEGGKIKYPRLGHLTTGDAALDADGADVTFVASWLDKALVFDTAAGGYRIVPAATRVKKLS